MEGEVITPLNRLLMMFAGPVKVIKKRHDKLLDYDNAQGKVKSIRDAEQLKVVSMIRGNSHFKREQFIRLKFIKEREECLLGKKPSITVNASAKMQTVRILIIK